MLERFTVLAMDGRRVSSSIGPQEKAKQKIIFQKKAELPDTSGIYGYRRYYF